MKVKNTEAELWILLECLFSLHRVNNFLYLVAHGYFFFIVSASIAVAESSDFNYSVAWFQKCSRLLFASANVAWASLANPFESGLYCAVDIISYSVYYLSLSAFVNLVVNFLKIIICYVQVDQIRLRKTNYSWLIFVSVSAARPPIKTLKISNCPY